MVLTVVDTRRLIVNENLYRFKLFENNIKEMIEQARSYNIEVIYVRHDDGEGNELTKGTEGFEFYDGFSPMAGEQVFDKYVNSTFDNEFMSAEKTCKYYNSFIWNKRYAECISSEKTPELMKC